MRETSITLMEKAIVAFKDNRKDLLKAREDGDYEEEKYCEGYECAMLYILGLLGVSHAEAMRKR